MRILEWLRDNRIINFGRRIVSSLGRDNLLTGAILGALLGIVLSAALGPMITGGIAQGINSQNLDPYKTPELGVSLTGGAGYTVKGEDLERFGGAEYNDSVRVYEIRVSNRGDRPIEHVNIDMPLPGCVMDYDKTGLGADISVNEYVYLDLRGQGEGLDTYSCSQTIKIDRLYPGDEIRIRYLLRVEFDKCDLLQGVGRQNTLTYDYYWQKNGIQFYESGKVSMGFQEDFLNTYDFNKSSIVVGENVRTDGVIYTNIIIDDDADSIPESMGQCRLENG